MNLKKVFCCLDIHDYRLKRKIFNDKSECVKTYYICRDCGKIEERDNDKESEKYNLDNMVIKKNEKLDNN